MYTRVTLLEIDTVRVTVEEAAELFKTDVLPQLREHEGFEGVVVLATPEGKGMILSLWETEDAASRAAGFASGVLDQYMALFRSPPGREYYEVAFADVPGVTVG